MPASLRSSTTRSFGHFSRASNAPTSRTASTAATPGCQRHEVQALGRQVGPEQHRHEKRGTGRGGPGAPVTTPARRLLVGDRDDPLGTPTRRFGQEVTIGRVDAGEPANLAEPRAGEPAIEIGRRAPGGGGIRHHP